MKILSKIKKNDWILLGMVIAAALLISLMRHFLGDPDAGYVTVRVDGEITGTYSLSEEQEVELNDGTNTMRIEEGRVKMVSAECPDKLCVHQKAISEDGQSIICLPNRVVLQVVSQDEADLDAMAN